MAICSLSEFTDSFINTLLEDHQFYEMDDGVGDERFDRKLADEANSTLKALCLTFFKTNENDIHLIEGRGGASGVQEAGYLFYMTIVGHGIGFWDTTIVKDQELADRLDNACKPYGLYVYTGDDGLVYT